MIELKTEIRLPNDQRIACQFTESKKFSQVCFNYNLNTDPFPRCARPHYEGEASCTSISEALKSNFNRSFPFAS